MYFIDLRAISSGGSCAPSASIWNDGSVPVIPNDFADQVHGRDILLVTHGFNVDRPSGVSSLDHWCRLLTLPDSYLAVGVLWPGDSSVLPVLDYPLEGRVAIEAGRRLASFLNRYGRSAASISMVSHSLGGRMVLEATRRLQSRVHRLIVMAGAIENDCLCREYKEAAKNAEKIVVIASRSDLVLAAAFPIGNLVGEIIMRGHPYDREALGREGPDQPLPLEKRGAACQIPDNWNYGHLDYLAQVRETQPLPLQTLALGTDTPPPDGTPGWKPAWSAAAVSGGLL